MSPVVRIPDSTYKRLEKEAVGFDTPANVIERLLDYYENRIEEGNDYSTERVSKKDSPPTHTPEPLSNRAHMLSALQQRDLTKIKPISITIENQKIIVNSWVDACVKLVDWLIRHNYLTANNLPIPIAAGNDKFFINNKPSHSNERFDGTWKEVGNNIFVDVKYNANTHVSNFVSALEHLNLDDLGIRIELNPN